MDSMSWNFGGASESSAEDEDSRAPVATAAVARPVAQIRAPRYRADGARPQLSQLPAAPLEALRRAATDVLAPSRPCASARAAAARSKLPAASETSTAADRFVSLFRGQEKQGQCSGRSAHA